MAAGVTFLILIFSALSLGPYFDSLLPHHPGDLFKYEKPTLLQLALSSCVFSKSIDKKDKVAVRTCAYCIMDLLRPKPLRNDNSFSSIIIEDETLNKYKEEELSENLTETQVAKRFCAHTQQMTACHFDEEIESGIRAACSIRATLFPAVDATRKRAQCDENGAIRDCTSNLQETDLTQPLKCATFEEWSQCLAAALRGCPGSVPVKTLLHHLRSTATDCKDDYVEKW